MGNNFLKLKTKYIMTAVLKSVIIGVSCGLLAVGAVLLSLKLCSIKIHFAYFILIGVGTAVLSGGALFGLLYKFGLSNEKIAKKIDRDYELNERVQTVVEYGEEQSDVLNLLREDTERRLGNLPKRKTSFAKVMAVSCYYIVVSVLSLALLLTAACLPAHYDEGSQGGPSIDIPVAEDPPFEYTLDLQSQMYDLMRDVLNSSLQQEEKDAVSKVLEDLDKQVLPSLTLQSELKLAMQAATIAINGLIDNANTFLKVRDALKDFDEPLSKAIEQGVIFYKAFNYKLVDLDMVKGQYGRVNSNIDEALARLFTDSYNAHKFTEDENNAVQGDAVLEYRDNLASALTALTEMGVKEEDEMYEAIANFQKAVSGVYGKFLLGGYTVAGLNEGTETSLILAYDPNLKTALTDAILLQCYNAILANYTRQKFADIFVNDGVSLKDLDELYDLKSELVNGDDGSGSTGDPSQGGYGTGEENFGSKDLIYDTELGEQIEYGKVFQNYYSKVDDRIKELPQDLVDFINEYFKILLNGIKTEDSEGAKG